MKCAAARLALAAVGATEPTRLYVVDANVPPGDAGDGLWRPTFREAAEAREALKEYLRSPKRPTYEGLRGRDAARIAAEFDSYTVQAEGVRAPGPRAFYGVDGNGPKQIHLDGFCQASATHMDGLASRQLIVMDGGSCIFQAMYDVRSRRITFFASNGYA